jgi:hypothetical protein
MTSSVRGMQHITATKTVPNKRTITQISSRGLLSSLKIEVLMYDVEDALDTLKIRPEGKDV